MVKFHHIPQAYLKWLITSVAKGWLISVTLLFICIEQRIVQMPLVTLRGCHISVQLSTPATFPALFCLKRL